MEIVTLRVVNYSIGENIILEPGRSKEIDLDGIFSPDNPDDDLTYSPNFDTEQLQKRLDEQWQPRYIFVTYVYAGTGQKRYTKFFSIRPVAVPWRSEEPVTWVANLVPMKDYDNVLEEQSE